MFPYRNICAKYLTSDSNWDIIRKERELDVEKISNFQQTETPAGIIIRKNRKTERRKGMEKDISNTTQERGNVGGEQKSIVKIFVVR